MRLVKNSMKPLIGIFFVALLIGCTLICVSCYWISINTGIKNKIEIWITGCKIVDFFFPLLVTAPFTWSLYIKRKNGFIEYVGMREKKKRYILAEILGGVIFAGILACCIYCIGLVFSLFIFEPQIKVEQDRLAFYLFGQYQVNQPFIFGVLWSLWKGIVAMILCIFGYELSLTVERIFVVVLGPFLYCTLENFITGILGLEQYSVCTSYILNRLSPESMDVYYLFLGLLIMEIGMFAFFLVFRAKEKEVSKCFP